MNAAGIEEVPDCDKTVFFDDADIPEAMKGYVATAHSLGYVQGSAVKGELCFLPNDEITRAEAAVMLAAIADLDRALVTPVFADSGEIPSWARDAIHSLHAAGILQATDGSVLANEPLTRAETAKLLTAVMAYVA